MGGTAAGHRYRTDCIRHGMAIQLQHRGGQIIGDPIVRYPRHLLCFPDQSFAQIAGRIAGIALSSADLSTRRQHYQVCTTQSTSVAVALRCCVFVGSVIKRFIFGFSDFRKLQRDFPEVSAQRMIENSKDLGVWCNRIINSSGVWSLARLVAFIVSMIWRELAHLI